MSIFISIVLGAVQGLTEFLPISSSGHLVLMEELFKVEPNLFFNVTLHLGSLLAVIVVYNKDILYLLKHPLCDESKKLIVATIPTVIVILILKSTIENSFTNNFFIFGFMITAFVLTLTDMIISKRVDKKVISYKSALIMGVAQGLAGFPGVSRSGSTICAGLLSKENRENVTKFSFLMSIPIIIASAVYEVLFDNVGGDINISSLIIGFLCAFIFGIIAIKIMIKIIKKAKLKYFAIYLVVISVILTLWNVF